MSEYLVTYDFKEGDNRQWEEFVKCAEIEGLLYVYSIDEKLYRLTNTTLWGMFATRETARDAFENAKIAANKRLTPQITLQKRIITKLSDSFILSDKKKKADPRWTKGTKFETCRAHQKGDPFFAY